VKYVIKTQSPPFSEIVHTQTDHLQFAMEAAAIIAKTSPRVRVYHGETCIAAHN
jgi:hypothetical protein